MCDCTTPRICTHGPDRDPHAHRGDTTFPVSPPRRRSGPCGGLVLSRRRFLAGTAAVGALAGLSACSVNPATGRSTFTGFMSPQDEAELGAEEHPKILEAFGGEYDDPKLTRFVNDIGRRVATNSEMPNLPYRFTVLNTPIVNAMALPGGNIYITRGLVALANNEAELAGVLAHEVGHVTARHTAERYSQSMLAQFGLFALDIAAAAAGIGGLSDIVGIGAGAYLQGFSRDQELEADTLGVRYMSRAGYTAEAMVGFLDTLRQHDIVEAHMEGRPEDSVDEYHMMATHPRTVDRVQAAIEAVRGSNGAMGSYVGRESYLGVVDGLLFGDEPSQGIVRGNTFVHPGLGFQFTVPEGYRLVNSEERVEAHHPSGAVIRFDIARLQTGGSMPQVLQSWSSRYALRGIETIDVNGQPGATGYARDTVQGTGVDIRPVVIRRDTRSVYRFLFITPLQTVDRSLEDLKRTTYSLRPLSATEARGAQPLRVLVVPTQAGDTVDRLSRTMPFGPFNEEWFRLLNDLEPGERLPPGVPVKVVTG